VPKGAGAASSEPVIHVKKAKAVSLAEHPGETDAKRAARLKSTATLDKIPDFSILTKKLSTSGALTAFSIAAVGDIEKAADKAVSKLLAAEAAQLLKDTPVGESDSEDEENESTPGAAAKYVKEAAKKAKAARVAATVQAVKDAAKTAKPAAAKAKPKAKPQKPVPALKSRSGRAIVAPVVIYDPDE
jgi:hypothetical protein